MGVKLEGVRGARREGTLQQISVETDLYYYSAIVTINPKPAVSRS